MPKPTVLARHLIAILLSVSGGLSHAGDTQVKAEQLFKSANGFDEQQHPGQIIYQRHCASCHEGGVPKAPHREMLGTLPITAILNAVTDGIMKLAGDLLNLIKSITCGACSL